MSNPSPTKLARVSEALRGTAEPTRKLVSRGQHFALVRDGLVIVDARFRLKAGPFNESRWCARPRSA
jgi:hypothetical protein